MNVCLLSCHRPFNFALVFMLLHELLSATIGVVGSLGLFCSDSNLPIRAGMTYHSGLMVLNRLVHQ
jgi:hypothetical protein